MCVLGTLRCALDGSGGGEGGVFSCLPLCHVLFLGSFHWFSEGYAPWLRGSCMGADGVVGFVCVFGLGFWRDMVGRVAVVLSHGLSRRVLGSEIWGILSWGEGQYSNFGVVCADCGDVLVGIVGWLSVTDKMCVVLVFLFCPF